MIFASDHLPGGLSLDPATGRFDGYLTAAGEYPVILRATNAPGTGEKKLSIVAGIFSLGRAPANVGVSWQALGASGLRRVRDLWRQRDLGDFPNCLDAEVAPHGVVVI